MKKLMIIALVTILLVGVVAGSAMAAKATGIVKQRPKKVTYDEDGLHIPDHDGVAENPISIGGSGAS